MKKRRNISKISEHFKIDFILCAEFVLLIIIFLKFITKNVVKQKIPVNRSTMVKSWLRLQNELKINEANPITNKYFILILKHFCIEHHKLADSLAPIYQKHLALFLASI